MNQNQEQLRVALSRCGHHSTIKLLAVDGRITAVTLSEARSLIARGTYAWAGTKHRVKQMKLMHYGRYARVECYRTCGAPAMPISLDWLRRMYGA